MYVIRSFGLFKVTASAGSRTALEAQNGQLGLKSAQNKIIGCPSLGTKSVGLSDRRSKISEKSEHVAALACACTVYNEYILMYVFMHSLCIYSKSHYSNEAHTVVPL